VFLRENSRVLLITLLITTTLSAIPSVKSANAFELTPTGDNHIVELNSDQPFVAGFHVSTPNLDNITRGVMATAITVSFPSTDPHDFPPSSWLGAGMFVQAQDSRYLHIDYGFYTILVLDATGDMFIDVGLHQTREDSLPLHMPTEQLVYAYTWQISGVQHETPVTLGARWDSDGWVHYSIHASGLNSTLLSINVAGLPDCENIIRKFYAGNVRNMPFPFGCLVQYFQFGVVSSESIADPHWSVDLKDPRFFREQEWCPVDTAWSIEGDISYLDSSWMWGGLPYTGVFAWYHQHPLDNLYEVVFFHNGRTLPYGTILWQGRDEAASFRAEGSAVRYLPHEAVSSCLLWAFILIVIFQRGLHRRRLRV
jgi:hypothetical protein